MSSQAVRDLIPDEITLPCEHTDAVISVAIVVLPDQTRVVAPGLHELQGALARGSVELVKHYCEMWTRWLTRAQRAVAS